MHVSRAGQLHYRMTALVSGGVLPSLFFLRASLAWSRFGMGVVFPILHPRDVSPSPSLPLSLSLSRARSWAWEASEASAEVLPEVLSRRVIKYSVRAQQRPASVTDLDPSFRHLRTIPFQLLSMECS